MSRVISIFIFNNQVNTINIIGTNAANILKKIVCPFIEFFHIVGTDAFLLDVFMLIKIIPVVHVVEAYILWNIVCKL